jgi:hypothetical protein
MHDLPKISIDAQRARAAIEEAFTRMAHRHKWHTGADIRTASKAVVLAALRAWRDRDDKLARVRELCAAVDVLKLELQLGKDVNAFRSWAEFEAIIDLVDEVGRQSGGWLNRLQPKGRNARAEQPPEQRALILSSQAAHGATP